MTGALRARKSDPASAPRPRVKVRARVAGREKVRAPRKSGRAVSADGVSAPDVFDERSDHRVVVNGVEWRTYLAMTRDPGFEHRKLTYDEGVIEIMSPGALHEDYGRAFGRLLDALCEEVGWKIRGGGRRTMREAPRRKGLEPDECYRFSRGRLRPRGRPQLAVEVELSRPAVDKLKVYAALGIGEVWRFDGTDVRVAVLSETGTWRSSVRSRVLPFLRPEALVPWVMLHQRLDDGTAWIRRFRAWVRLQDFPVAPAGDPPDPDPTR